MRRVAFVGLDGLEPALAGEMLAAGELPELAALRARGLWCGLADTRDHRSGIVWEHLLTGRGCAGNRRWSVVRFTPETYATAQEGAHPFAPFYDDGAGGAPRVLSFDVPYTSLASAGSPDGGIWVTGWGAHDPGHPRAARPAGWLRWIDARFGPHPCCNNDYACTWWREDALERQCEALLAGARLRPEVLGGLAERGPDWELLLTVLSEGHSAGEQLWHGIDPRHPLAGEPGAKRAGDWLRRIYRALDESLGRIARGLPEDAHLVVASLHGMQTNVADALSMAILPELLQRWQGRPSRLRAAADPETWRRAGCPPLRPDPALSWLDDLRRLRPPEGAAPRVPARGRLEGWWRRLRGASDPRDAVPRGPLGEPIPPETTASPEEIGVYAREIRSQPTVWYRDDWPLLRAFALPTFYDGRIRLNLSGREGRGVVALEDYERTCDEVEALLRACRDLRTGRPVVAELERVRARDPFDPEGPDADLVVQWAVASDAVVHPALGAIGPFPFRRPGGHSPRGLLSLTGPGVARAELGERSARDVTPTLLRLLGRRAPAGSEGEALPAALLGRA